MKCNVCVYKRCDECNDKVCLLRTNIVVYLFNKFTHNALSDSNTKTDTCTLYTLMVN